MYEKKGTDHNKHKPAPPRASRSGLIKKNSPLTIMKYDPGHKNRVRDQHSGHQKHG